MPAAKPSSRTPSAEPLPCESCRQTLFDRIIPRCLNCRREVESSLTRMAGRRLRKIRKMPSCTVGKCSEFLLSVGDPELRLHLAAMAWWRFSSDGEESTAKAIQRIMEACPAFKNDGGPSFGEDYMQRAIRAISPLTTEQITAWFGCDDVYKMASLFYGERPTQVGKHCLRCRLYKAGCTAHGLLGADDCPFWNNPFVQGIARAVVKNGGWRDPCAWVEKTTRRTPKTRKNDGREA